MKKIRWQRLFIAKAKEVEWQVFAQDREQAILQGGLTE